MQREEKKKKKTEKRGDQIELKLRVLSTGVKIKSGGNNWGKKKKKRKRKEGTKLSSNSG
jgi:hypothetical protein